jgi:predicted nucleotidyltransferase
MRPNPTVVLTDTQSRIVAAILAERIDRIGPVNVFGSRSTGRARPGSDLDLVVFGQPSERDLTDLWLAFEESDLPIKVEVVVWDKITSQRFRDEIARYAIPFFEEAFA